MLYSEAHIMTASLGVCATAGIVNSHGMPGYPEVKKGIELPLLPLKLLPILASAGRRSTGTHFKKKLVYTRDFCITRVCLSAYCEGQFLLLTLRVLPFTT